MAGSDDAVFFFLKPFEAGFAPGFRRTVFRVLVIAVLALFPFGLSFVSGGLLPRQFRFMSTVSVVLYGLVALVSELRTHRPAAVIPQAVVLFFLVFGIEWVGVNTGIPFGGYAYTENLPPLVVGVPPAIAMAWIGVIFSSWRLAQAVVPRNVPTRFSRVTLALAAAVLALAFDTALEPTAAFVQEYWLWEGGSVPAQNSIAWFTLSFLAVLSLEKTSGNARETSAGGRATAVFIYGLQFVTFLVAGLAHGFAANAAFAVSLVLGVLLAAFLGRGKWGRKPAQRFSGHT